MPKDESQQPERKRRKAEQVTQEREQDKLVTERDGFETSVVVREGEVYESLADADDDAGGGRRMVKVIGREPDADGQVHVENTVTGRVSHIHVDRLQPPYWRRYFS